MISMHSRSGDPATGDVIPQLDGRQVDRDYRRLLVRLTARASRLGSSDPEACAQEALRRSLESETSQAAVEFYFREQTAPETEPPGWSLDQLLAWLHGVLHYVVREEQSKARSRRELYFDSIGADSSTDGRHLDPRD